MFYSKIMTVLLATAVAITPLPSTVPELGEIGNPRSSYKIGSAKCLIGKNVLCSIFVDTPDAKWTEKEKEKTLKNLQIAEKYIEQSARDYLKKTDLILDFKEDSALSTSATIDFSVKDGEDYEEALDQEIASWLTDNISLEEQMDKYRAKGGALLVFINHKGRSYAITYDGIDAERESVVLFAEESPAVYAHEILHIFGAHDLYEGAEYTGDVCEYVKAAYPEELMYTVQNKNKVSVSNEITNIISPITAYHLGWTSYTEEIDIFPELKRK